MFATCTLSFWLLPPTCSWNRFETQGRTPLHLAAAEGHKHVVALLLDNGAEVDARDDARWTPLDWAAANGMTNTARVLLENDAPVESMDKNQTTPLHLAAEAGHPSVVRCP